VRAIRREHAPRDLGIPAAGNLATACTEGGYMTWQTPTATDFRFGFEITMYVAAR